MDLGVGVDLRVSVGDCVFVRLFESEVDWLGAGAKYLILPCEGIPICDELSALVLYERRK